MTRKYIITVITALLVITANAQSLSEEYRNFLHPVFSELSSIYQTKNLTSGDLSTKTLAITTVAFNKGGVLELNAGYYITRNCIYGLDLTARPSQNLKLKLGIQKLPYLIEANANIAKHPFFGFSQQVSYLGGYSDLTGMSTRGRDFGFSVEGDFLPVGDRYVLNFVAGVFNGAGLQFRDVDRKKDFAGRIVLHPVKSVHVSAGALVGWYSPEDEYGAIGDPMVKRRFSAGLQWDGDGWFYRFEDCYGITDHMRSNGISTYGGRQFTDKTSLAVKYDRFHTDLADETSVSTKVGAGFSHAFAGPLTMKCQYEHVFHSSPLANDSDSVTLCLMLSFSAHL